MIDLFLRETEEAQSPAAHKLLLAVLEREYGIKEPVLRTGPQGKPYLEEGPEFNLSHTHGAVAAAISKAPVGLDMEKIRSYLPALPGRVLSPREFAWFQSRGELKKDFFTLWTLKESFFKFQGTGLTGFPNGTDFYYEDRWRLRDSDLNFWVFCEKNLLMALCSREQVEVNFHRF